MDNWYDRSFGDDYLIVYKHRNMEKAKMEAQAMAGWLQLPARAEVLDLCCGMGRHALALQEMGYGVTGIDLSASLLRVAREKDQQQLVTWVQGDMRALPFENRFDAVVNMFTSFGYFMADSENAEVLHQIRKVLKPGGVWLIDFLNPAHVRANLVPQSDRVINGHHIQESRVLVEDRVEKTIDLIRPDGEHVTYHERVKLYELAWFERHLRAAGLDLQVVYGDYDKVLYDANSPRMIMVGKVSAT